MIPVVATQVHILTSNELWVLPSPLHALVIVCFLDDILTGDEVESQTVLICISLIIKDIEHFV